MSHPTSNPTNKPATAPLLHKKPEAAQLLQISIRSLENEMRMKQIAIVRIGKRGVRFRGSDLVAYIERHRLRAAGE